jgi:hypothetical protein
MLDGHLTDMQRGDVTLGFEDVKKEDSIDLLMTVMTILKTMA